MVLGLWASSNGLCLTALFLVPVEPPREFGPIGLFPDLFFWLLFVRQPVSECAIPLFLSCFSSSVVSA